jgi:hypothetical protein
MPAIPSKIPFLTGITEDTILDRRMLSACFDTQSHADRAWDTYQKLVELLTYVHGADSIPEELEVLREIDIHELDRGIDGLTIRDVIRLADMAEVVQVVDPVHVKLSGVSWDEADLQALTHLRNGLYTNLPA